MSGVEIMQSIIEILVGGISGVAEGVGEGLSTLAQSIFLQTTGEPDAAVTELSTFGVLIVVFAGISLAIGLCRWVVNFISSLGARNR